MRSIAMMRGRYRLAQTGGYAPSPCVFGSELSADARDSRGRDVQKEGDRQTAGPLTPPNACLAFGNNRRRGFALAVVLRTACDTEESKQRGQW